MDSPENTRLIPLSQGQFVIVDAEDYDFLMQWKWHARRSGNTFYAARTTWNPRVNIQMHRLINNTPDGMETDHINGNGLDNRKSNLRAVTKTQNCRNQRKKIGCTSGYKGVYWNKSAKKWRAQIKHNQEVIYLGSFLSEKDAHAAYVEASVKYHGSYGNTQTAQREAGQTQPRAYCKGLSSSPGC